MIPMKLVSGDGVLDWYKAIGYFYITAAFIPEISHQWGLIKISDGTFEICTSVSSRIGDIDDRGRLKIIGVDMVD